MKILPIASDPNQYPHIDRVADMAEGNLYLIETVADYSAIPSRLNVPPPVGSVARAVADKKAAADLLAKEKRDAVVVDVSPAEMSSWPIKRAEAIAWSADNAASTPLLSAESAARGMALADLVAKVLANSANLLALEAAIAGTNGRHSDALDALASNPATTVEQVEAYEITTGWPV